MERRSTYVSADELNREESSVIRQSITNLFQHVISKNFTWFEGVHYHMNVNNASITSHIILSWRLARSSEIDQYKDYSSREFIQDYINNRGTILGNLTKDLIPAVKDEQLIETGLSPEDYVIHVVRFNMEADTITNNSSPDVFVNEIIDIDFEVIIDDVSRLKPGEFESSLIRYQYLCREGTTTSIQELRQWAAQLGYGGTETASKEQLCVTIANHYGFP